jgi:hypothetical protein
LIDDFAKAILGAVGSGDKSANLVSSEYRIDANWQSAKRVILERLREVSLLSKTVPYEVYILAASKTHDSI